MLLNMDKTINQRLAEARFANNRIKGEFLCFKVFKLEQVTKTHTLPTDDKMKTDK